MLFGKEDMQMWRRDATPVVGWSGLTQPAMLFPAAAKPRPQ